MPKVSVIIPTYNREPYIESTIQSVLDQTYTDFEIIIVDDGSTDNTKKRLEKFRGKIKIISQKNSERAVSRNNGIKNSNGKYIALVDSDDIWIKDKLERQVTILDENKDIILCYGHSLRINDKGEKIIKAKRQTQGFSGDVFENLLIRNFIVSATPLLRRESFEATSGFQTRYIPYEDWEFWIRLSLIGKFYFLNEPLAYYRIHEEQSVKQARAEKIEEVTTSLLNDSYKLKKINESIKKKSLGLANLRFCYWYLIANNKEKAKEKIQKALELYPLFLADPRWYGLRLICKFPELKNIIHLESFH